MTDLKECPLCGSKNVACYAEYCGDSYDNQPLYRAVVACLGCHEDSCDPYYDDEPCFGMEAYFPGSHPLIRDLEDPDDCEKALARHMAERWNRRAERTCTVLRGEAEFPHCSNCGGLAVVHDVYGPFDYCPECGAKVVSIDAGV